MRRSCFKTPLAPGTDRRLVGRGVWGEGSEVLRQLLRTGEGTSGGLFRFSRSENGTVPLRSATVVFSPVLSRIARRRSSTQCSDDFRFGRRRRGRCLGNFWFWRSLGSHIVYGRKPNRMAHPERFDGRDVGGCKVRVGQGRAAGQLRCRRCRQLKHGNLERQLRGRRLRVLHRWKNLRQGGGCDVPRSMMPRNRSNAAHRRGGYLAQVFLCALTPRHTLPSPWRNRTQHEQTCQDA